MHYVVAHRTTVTAKNGGTEERYEKASPMYYYKPETMDPSLCRWKIAMPNIEAALTQVNNSDRPEKKTMTMSLAPLEHVTRYALILLSQSYRIALVS